MARNTQSREPAPQAQVASPEAAPKAPKAPKATKPCECGCGTLVPRRFAPGHDGRLKGNLIRTIKAARLLGNQGAADQAEQAMAKLGWTKFIPAE